MCVCVCVWGGGGVHWAPHTDPCVRVETAVMHSCCWQTLYDSFMGCEVSPRQLRSQSHDAVEHRIKVEHSSIDLLHIGKD